jgi:hypothetical protein
MRVAQHRAYLVLAIVLVAFVVFCLPQEIDHHSD